MAKKKKTKQKQSDKPYPLQVRLSDTVRKMLADAAKAGDRTMAREIQRRLEASLTGAAIEPATPPPFAGWPAADADDFQALGDIAAQFFARVTLAAGPKQSPQRRLGLLRPALMALLDELGAEDIGADDAAYFDRAARDWVHDELIKRMATAYGGVLEESAIARAARELFERWASARQNPTTERKEDHE